MKIRPIKVGHTTNCIYCKAEGHKVQAVWHLTGANVQACTAHKPELVSLQQAEQSENHEYSEADHQSWLRL